MLGHPNQKQKIGKRGHGHPSNNEFRRRRKSRQQKKHFIMDDDGNIWGKGKEGEMMQSNRGISLERDLGFGCIFSNGWLNLWEKAK